MTHKVSIIENGHHLELEAERAHIGQHVTQPDASAKFGYRWLDLILPAGKLWRGTRHLRFKVVSCAHYDKYPSLAARTHLTTVDKIVIRIVPRMAWTPFDHRYEPPVVSRATDEAGVIPMGVVTGVPILTTKRASLEVEIDELRTFKGPYAIKINGNELPLVWSGSVWELTNAGRDLYEQQFFSMKYGKSAEMARQMTAYFLEQMQKRKTIIMKDNEGPMFLKTLAGEQPLLELRQYLPNVFEVAPGQPVTLTVRNDYGQNNWDFSFRNHMGWLKTDTEAMIRAEQDRIFNIADKVRDMRHQMNSARLGMDISKHTQEQVLADARFYIGGKASNTFYETCQVKHGVGPWARAVCAARLG